MRVTFGEVIDGLAVDGRPLRSAVFDENQVRAAAGTTMVLGAVAFGYAFLAGEFAPIRIVTVFFVVEFLIRVTAGLRYSPVGILARRLTRGAAPVWASARPKRFAWTLGLLMSLAMAVITNVGIRGALPATICLICLALMWAESVLGRCLGCEVHGLLVRRGLATKDDAFEICAYGACEVPGARPAQAGG